VNRLTVTNLQRDDIDDILDISLECGLCLWSADAYRSELVREDSIMLKLVDDAGHVAGFAVGRVFELAPDEFTVELTNIGLRQAYRNQGFGRHLLTSFINRCIEQGIDSVVLEVRESNHIAQRFYDRFGFRPTGRRRGFYSNPVEDALTMRLSLAGANSYLINTPA
jgi:ribosomal-protein-alanine N-acetyltransferase